MTREEAIKVLRTESVEIGGNAVSVCRFWEALDMAIAALRQQEHFREVTKKVEPLTNAQKIRAMSDEEIAEFLYQVGYDNGWGMKEYALEWLQQPAEEDDHA